MINRGLIVALTCGLLTLPLTARAQQKGKVYRIGILCVGDCPAPPLDTGYLAQFVTTLREQGYIDGRNVVLDPSGIGDSVERLPTLSARLLGANVDVILAMGALATVAASEATKITPIVMAGVPNALELGLIASLARPGGNVAGVTVPFGELIGKQLELLKEVAPQLQRVAMIRGPMTPWVGFAHTHAEGAGRSLALQVHPIMVRIGLDLDVAFAEVARERAGAILVIQDSAIERLKGQLILRTLSARLPSGRRVPGVPGGGRSDGLWSRLGRDVRPGREGRRPDLEGCPPGGHSG